MAAEKLENDFGDCKLVEQIWVYGNSYEVGSDASSIQVLPGTRADIICGCC